MCIAWHKKTKSTSKKCNKEDLPVTDFYEQAKERLLALRREVSQRITNGHQDFQSTTSHFDTADQTDSVACDLDKQMLDALGTQNLRALTKIDAALARLGKGTYGVCVKCGVMIDKGRLEAIPEAVLCVQCQAVSKDPKMLNSTMPL